MNYYSILGLLIKWFDYLITLTVHEASYSLQSSRFKLNFPFNII